MDSGKNGFLYSGGHLTDCVRTFTPSRRKDFTHKYVLDRFRQNGALFTVKVMGKKNDLDIISPPRSSLFYPHTSIAISFAESSKSGVLLQGTIRALFQGYPMHLPIFCYAYRGTVQEPSFTAENINLIFPSSRYCPYKLPKIPKNSCCFL